MAATFSRATIRLPIAAWMATAADPGAPLPHRAPDRLDPDPDRRHRPEPGDHHPALAHRSPSTRCFRQANVRAATALTNTSPTTHCPTRLRTTGASSRSSWVIETRTRGDR